jgi:uncharacterized protein YndB with AHSA1/START domain
MREVTVSVVISAPREEVFDFVSDLAARPAYTDHYLQDYRLYEFTPEAGGTTRVELTTYSEPATAVDRIKEIGAAWWIRRKTRKSLERLRKIFEEPQKEPLKRVTVAGYDPSKAARFGTATGMDPARSTRQ